MRRFIACRVKAQRVSIVHDASCLRISDAGRRYGFRFSAAGLEQAVWQERRRARGQLEVSACVVCARDERLAVEP